MSELPKTFEPRAIEDRWYAHWEGNGLFRPERPSAEPWTIVNPPPNVTGSLHIGHALDNTLQDIVTRRERMLGKDALWVVGMDHAGIATQMVVERQLELHQDKRTNYSRDEFVQKVWQWKEESGGQITGQLRRLGCSMDWSNERFTMDEGFTRAVLKVFVQLYREGLLYRDKRLVNWDPKFQSAISDLEVDSREVAGYMWHFKYPLAGGQTYTYVERDEDGNVLFEEERDYISIATTRPETMLGDGAVAVHPDDERYRPIVGSFCEIPVGPKEHRRLIPIIIDSYPDPHFGSGAVKITGAHDLNDYGVAQRNNIPMYRLMDERAHMRSDGAPYAECAERARAIARGEAATAAEVDELNLVPDIYRGLDRYEARERVVADIDSEGLMIKVEDKPIMQPFGDRSGVVIEPMLTDQWYVDAATLAKPAIEAARTSKIEIVPKTWEKTWFNWLENIQPWCVSRQLWWGHRIPAWYDEDGNVYVAETEEEARAEAGGKPLRQDEDVLDTWFSSALWPFATIGWPEQTRELERHYPNDLLISGFDIIFFWDARMAMQGIHFMGEVPWKRLYLHGLVRDAQGQKMSKSKGNTVDPLGLIDRYGADALRFTLAAMESQGRDIKLDEKRVEGYRNFATKLWNAARFLQMNGVGASDSIAAPKAELPVNRWIIGEVVETLAKLDRAFDELRFDDMANAVYHFVWATFCDWYVELVKGAFDEETRRVAAWAFDQILVMLHPLMPFITEELWAAMGERPYELIVAKWPQPEASVDSASKAEMEWLIRLVRELRSFRAEYQIPPQRIDVKVVELTIEDEVRLHKYDPQIRRIAGLAGLLIQVAPQGVLSDDFGNQPPITFQGGRAVGVTDTAQISAGSMTMLTSLAGIIDVAAEKGRISKELKAAEKERDGLAARLNNPNFTERAKPEAVEKARADHDSKAAEAERLRAALERLG